MGKKSKRNRTTKQKQQEQQEQSRKERIINEEQQKEDALQNSNLAPSLRKNQVVEEETKDNLKFEDPYEDVFEEEEEMITSDNENSNEDYDAMNNDKAQAITDNMDDEQSKLQQTIQSWTPLSNNNEIEELEITPEAYKLYYNLTTEWPCLSFDIIQDKLGHDRKKFPHSLMAVIGTQADCDKNNKITVLKLSDLGKMKQENEGEESDDEEKSDSEDEDDSDDEADHEPTLEYYSMKHEGSVNRLRVLQQSEQQNTNDDVIVSTWSSKGIVNLFNVSPLVQKFDMSTYKPGSKTQENTNRPFFVYSGHSSEGYAMDFNKKEYGTLATGDCSGAIHIWNYTSSSSQHQTYDQNCFEVSPYYKSEHSIEDIQWSPTEPTVLCSAECDGYVNIYDTRCKGRSMIHCLTQTNHKDVNVLAWNTKVSNLLATGSDDGVFSVWDLRNFSSTSKDSTSMNKPLARFQPCKKPITSIEWHPTDESMIVVSDEDTTYIYDLSVEVDEEEAKQQKLPDDVPPQMLFMHCGNQMTKEVHWHNQISSLVMTTSLNGFNVFIPSNL